MAQNTKKIKVFVTNLGKYNEGALVGEWLGLPASDDEIDAMLRRIGIGGIYEEYFITDYESDLGGIEFDEYESLESLNDIAEQLAELDDYELECVEALMIDGSTLQEALDSYSDCVVYPDCHDMTDIAYEVVESAGLLDSMPENLRSYFDYEAFGRDLGFEGRYVFLDNGDCVEILY